MRCDKVKKVLNVSKLDINNVKTEVYDGYPSHLDGRCEKMFFRVNSGCLKDYVEEVCDNEEASYISYVNEIIKEGYVPKKISVLCKDVSKRLDDEDESRIKAASCEVLSSQILNFFGCPTVFNKMVKGELDCETRYSVMSVDFLSYGEEITTLDALNCRFVGLNNAIKTVKGALQKYEGIFLDEQIEKVVEDFVYSYLIRRILLGDFDFIPVNIGIIENKEKGTLQLINFDFEGTFNGRYPLAKCDLIYCKNNYPEIYDRFLNKFMELYNGMEDLRCKRKLNIDAMGCVSNYEHLLDTMDNIYDVCRPRFYK